MESPVEDDEITLLKQSNKFLKELGGAFASIEDVKEDRVLDGIVRKVRF